MPSRIYLPLRSRDQWKVTSAAAELTHGLWRRFRRRPELCRSPDERRTEFSNWTGTGTVRTHGSAPVSLRGRSAGILQVPGRRDSDYLSVGGSAWPGIGLR